MVWTALRRSLKAPLLGGVALLLLSTGTVTAKELPRIGNMDARVNGGRELNKALAVARSAPNKPAPGAPEIARQVKTMREALAGLQRTAPGATARFSTFTAAPEIVSAGKNALSAPAKGKPGIDVVRDFLHANATLYGLTGAQIDGLAFLGESVSPSGLRMVRVEQRINGVPVFGSETRFILDRDGRVWRSLGLLLPDGAVVSASSPALSAPQAFAKAMASVGIVIDPARVTAQETAGKVQMRVADDRIAGDVTSQLLYFPAAPGLLVLGWRQITFTSGDHDWNTIVDSASGALLFRKDMRASVSTQEARFSVYVKADGKTPADSPAPHAPTTVTPGSGTQFPEISRTTVNMSTAQDITVSPDGWIPDGGTTTTGNNVDACVDRVGGGGETNVCDIGTIDNNGRPVGNPDGASLNRDFLGTTPRNFSYTPAPSGGNPEAGDTPTGTGAVQIQFRRGAVTQLFYVTNWYHDQLYKLGFDEAAGNFQNTNFSGMGLGGDRVQADAQDSSGTNNANFSTPPDGTSGRMQMYRFTSPTIDRDGSIDSEIVMHELTHGTSNRLMGNGDGLIWSPGGGMGEGWSDFYAMSLLHSGATDDPNAEYASGAYATYKLGGQLDNYLYGIRRFPYSTDNTVNPMTWADADDVTADYSGGIAISPLGFEFNGAMEVHNIGEIWALTLWEVRSRVIAANAGNIALGNQITLQIVTDAMKLTPANPSYTDARDALIAADCATNACANEQSIWGGFADRGLGYGAVAPLAQVGFSNFGHMSVGESFSLPHLDVNGTTVDDTLGNNNGAIDPGEPIRLTVQVKNPWMATTQAAAAATATLTTSTAGVTILDNTSVYGAVAAQGTANGDTFLFTVPTSATCGQSINFTLHITSSLGTSDVDFSVRVGADAGNGAPVTYTKTLGSPLSIPDAEPTGIADTQTITDDFVINDLDFRVDNIQHTFTGDLTVMLRGPNGYGSDLIWLREALFGGGDGDNFINTVIDDASVNDLNQSADTDAPYTGDWQPAFNSDVWNLFGDPAIFPDPIGQLSRYNGRSTQGTWTIHVADNFQIDSGTLNAWSIIVTPKAFTCTAFAPAVTMTGTKTVSGTFNVGGTVTYTVTLTNNGSAVQADNTGHEFTDTLPAGLTLVSANATSGTASTAGNTVNWDGTLTLGGGSVTITITATINSGTAGQTISNQGSISYDANADGTNEATGVTDDPGTAAANDPTSFVVSTAAAVSGTKAVSGTPTEGATLTYTVVLTNNGTGAQGDNPGNEFTDVLPSSLTLVSATATSGTAVATVATNTVTWNGAIPAGGTVTITITATIKAGTAGQTVSNQGTISYDSNGDGTNDATATTDDPGTGAAGDPTSVTVAAAPVAAIPTLSEWGLTALAMALAMAALTLVRRRRTA